MPAPLTIIITGLAWLAIGAGLALMFGQVVRAADRSEGTDDEIYGDVPSVPVDCSLVDGQAPGRAGAGTAGASVSKVAHLHAARNGTRAAKPSAGLNAETSTGEDQ